MIDLSRQPPASPPLKAAPAGWALAVGFVALAAMFLFVSWESSPPEEDLRAIRVGDLGPVPLRRSIGDPPAMVIDGFAHRCQDCHRLFESMPDVRRPIGFHTEIVLNHGLNSRCSNCHDLTNHDRLVLLDGSSAPFSRVPEMCASCHGTTYRDWQRGMHGKTLGSWDPGDSRFRRLSCIECHDPHSPAFHDFVPLPPPRTLRMGEPRLHEAKSGRRDPLEHWLSVHPDEQAPAAPDRTPGILEMLPKEGH